MIDDAETNAGPTPVSDRAPVIVIGAGIAGLVCAAELHRAGRPTVVLEAAPEIGGRVRTSSVDGYTIDHGFQVLFSAYPTLRRYLDLDALAPRVFDPAARIVRGGVVSHVGDAFRHPVRAPVKAARLLIDTVMASAMSTMDKLRILALRRFVSSLSIDDCFAREFHLQSSRTLLESRGFSLRAIENFFAPFYGGILLDRTLSTTASTLLFTFKMLAEGETLVPAQGMGAIPAMIASALPVGAIRTGSAVRAIERDAHGVMSVSLDDGTRFEAPHVVLATDSPAAAALARTADVMLPIPHDMLGCTTLYYRTPSPRLRGASIWLNASPHATVSHATTITDVAPEYGGDERAGHSGHSGQMRPVRDALIAATVVGESAALGDETLDAAVRRDLDGMASAAGAAPHAQLTRLALWRVPYAQFAQPPGWRDGRIGVATTLPGLWRASEALHSSSLEGAARGGRAAAQAVLDAARPLSH